MEKGFFCVSKVHTAIPTLICMKLWLSRAPIYRHLMKHWTTEHRVFVFRKVILLSVCFHESAIYSLIDKPRMLDFNRLYSYMAEMYPYTDLFFPNLNKFVFLIQDSLAQHYILFWPYEATILYSRFTIFSGSWICHLRTEASRIWDETVVAWFSVLSCVDPRKSSIVFWWTGLW